MKFYKLAGDTGIKLEVEFVNEEGITERKPLTGKEFIDWYVAENGELPVMRELLQSTTISNEDRARIQVAIQEAESALEEMQGLFDTDTPTKVTQVPNGAINKVDTLGAKMKKGVKAIFNKKRSKKRRR